MIDDQNNCNFAFIMKKQKEEDLENYRIKENDIKAV